MNYEQARKTMKNARNPAKGKPIGNNTRLFFENPVGWGRPFGYESYYSVRLHGNEILRIYSDRFIPMDAGWKTVTTKARLNDLMPIGGIHQKNFDWYYTIGDTTYDWGDVYFVSTRDDNYGEVMLYSTHPKWPSQVQEVEA
jgi:subtilase family serine protease